MDEDLEEGVARGGAQLAQPLAGVGVRRDRGDQHQHAVAGEQARDVGDAVHVGVAIGARVAQAG
ncbi:MAG: hypothetical protein E6J91_39455 [Deltaproteobacteria bacterium]|nr:MAG: hypothetical protein E6J91_39455 [Deltaproteobacteria bacterium]